ncbi:MAG: hypothetical protein WBD20_21785, partial [Pirellulaceae bacterium]
MNDLPNSRPDASKPAAESKSTNPASAPGIVAADRVTPKTSRLRWALIVSLIGHAVLLVVLLFWYLPNRNADTTTKDASVAKTQAPAQTDRPAPPPELMTPHSGNEIPAEQIEKSIESQIDAVKKLPDEAKLSELDKNLKRLKSIATEQSVQQVTEKIGSTLGLDTQQYQPKNDVPEGRFDFDTAQLSDVTKRKGEKGNWIYDATLIDSKGRTSQVELSAAEGETMHEVFTKMKKYPMAAGIYRSVVMPML